MNSNTHENKILKINKTINAYKEHLFAGEYIQTNETKKQNIH